jgi:hypothetical protein
VTFADLRSLLWAICCGLIAVVLVYDMNRALWPRIAGEQRWRRGRVAATTTALIAVAVLQRSAGALWLRRLAVMVMVLAVAGVLRCSIPLKRLVANRLLQRQQEDD